MTSPPDRFRTAASRFSAALADVSAEAWTQPSRCAGWTIRDVVDHVVSTERDFLVQRSLSAPTIDGMDPAESWPLLRVALEAIMADSALVNTAYDGYFGPTTIGETVHRFYIVDLIVRCWDIATALGLSVHEGFDAQEMAAIEANLDDIPEAVLRSPGLFGPAVSVPEETPPAKPRFWPSSAGGCDSLPTTPA